MQRNVKLSGCRKSAWCVRLYHNCKRKNKWNWKPRRKTELLDAEKDGVRTVWMEGMCAVRVLSWSTYLERGKNNHPLSPPQQKKTSDEPVSRSRISNGMQHRQVVVGRQALDGRQVVKAGEAVYGHGRHIVVVVQYARRHVIAISPCLVRMHGAELKPCGRVVIHLIRINHVQPPIAGKARRAVSHVWKCEEKIYRSIPYDFRSGNKSTNGRFMGNVWWRVSISEIGWNERTRHVGQAAGLGSGAALATPTTWRSHNRWISKM